jgi:hypothetical protein
VSDIVFVNRVALAEWASDVAVGSTVRVGVADDINIYTNSIVACLVSSACMLQLRSCIVGTA